jgi:thioredoxin-like negative regulator of GroEL
VQAVAALERAQAMSRGFADVHRYLAEAYWRNGQMAKARDQMALLRSLDRGEELHGQLQQQLRLPFEGASGRTHGAGASTQPD